MGHNSHFVFIFCVFSLVLCFWAGCKTQQPVIIDTGDIERLRYEYQLLREEYNQLQSDYSRLVFESKFYADYYSNTTAAIANGIAELGELENDNATEIAKLREYIAIVRNIIQGIIAREYAERPADFEIDPD
jgi:hypothetical protein